MSSRENSETIRLREARERLARASKFAPDAEIISGLTKRLHEGNPGGLAIFEQGGFARNGAGALEFMNYMLELASNPEMNLMKENFARNPGLGSEFVNRWRQDVRANGNSTTSPRYEPGQNNTIIDRVATHLGQGGTIDPNAATIGQIEHQLNAPSANEAPFYVRVDAERGVAPASGSSNTAGVTPDKTAAPTTPAPASGPQITNPRRDDWLADQAAAGHTTTRLAEGRVVNGSLWISRDQNGAITGAFKEGPKGSVAMNADALNTALQSGSRPMSLGELESSMAADPGSALHTMRISNALERGYEPQAGMQRRPPAAAPAP
jgi:hypothetical protein